MSEQPSGASRAAAPAIPVFVNRDAGTADAVRSALSANTLCRVIEIEPQLLAESIRREIDGGATRVIVCGGDGTIRTAASVLAGTPVELGIIPAGTLNHFAKSIGLPDDPANAATIAVGDAVRGVDVGRVNDEVFINTSSVGTYVLFVRAREHYERYVGYRLASLLALVRVALALRSYRMVVEVHGERRAYITPLVFLGVGEREVKIPELGDRIVGGRRGLHLLVARGRERTALLVAIVIAALRGIRAVDRQPAGIDSFVGDRVRVELRGVHGHVAIDGELLEMRAPLEYIIERNALRVAAP